MLHIAICDDCPQQTEIIFRLLRKYQTYRLGFEMQLHSFTSGEKLLESIDSGSVFNLYLLDIIMPGLNGIELVLELRKRINDISVIFITSSVDYALNAYRVSAVQYIVKPVKEAELFPVLDKIVSMLKQESERFFVLSTPERTIKILFSTIVCVELYKRTIQVYLENGVSLQSKTIRAPFFTITAPLLQDTRFICVHKSYILNLAFVNELTANSFIMKNGIEVFVPRYKYADAKKKYFTYISEHVFN